MLEAAGEGRSWLTGGPLEQAPRVKSQAQAHDMQLANARSSMQRR
jgi:hypothetical protein